MDERPCIWLTRPLADSESLAAELAEHDIASIVAPVMRIEPKSFTPPAETPTALLLTSRYAADALALLPAAWHKLPLYCVGDATAACAKTYGFTNPPVFHGSGYFLEHTFTHITIDIQLRIPCNLDHVCRNAFVIENIKDAAQVISDNIIEHHDVLLFP